MVQGKGGLADNAEYGDAIIGYMEAKGMSWVAWVFDPDWYPSLLKSWDTYELTESGKFFREALRANAGNRQK